MFMKKGLISAGRPPGFLVIDNRSKLMRRIEIRVPHGRLERIT
ncbi:hypothetical protein ACJ2A9_17365 [Anaerobacillus sp. MEB173]